MGYYSGGKSNKHAKNGLTQLFLKKEFAELQIRLFCVEKMYPKASALELDRGVVNPFLFLFGGGVCSDTIDRVLFYIDMCHYIA